MDDIPEFVAEAAGTIAADGSLDKLPRKWFLMLAGLLFGIIIGLFVIYLRGQG
ncbi:hypothetical protein J4207_00475 [Candidatus Woesearchaeota archaeon]|nr:hypothetical protein [Candidatus Woesearchaeota archaeon]